MTTSGGGRWIASISDQFRPNTCAAPSTESCTALPAGGACMPELRTSSDRPAGVPMSENKDMFTKLLVAQVQGIWRDVTALDAFFAGLDAVLQIKAGV